MPKITLMTGETIVAEVRATLWLYMRGWIVSIALLVGVSYFLFWLLEQDLLGQIVVATGYTFGVYLFARGYGRWRSNVLIITTDRVIDVYKASLFRKEITSVRLRDIEDASSHIRGFWNTLFQIGEVKIVAKGDVTIVVDHVKKPARTQELLHELAQSEDVSSQRLTRERVVSYLKHLSAPNLDKLIREAMEILKEKRSK